MFKAFCMCPRYLQRSAVHWAEGIVEPLCSQFHHFTQGFIVFTSWLTVSCLRTKKEVYENNQHVRLFFRIPAMFVHKGKRKSSHTNYSCGYQELSAAISVLKCSTTVWNCTVKSCIHLAKDDEK